MQTQAWAFQTKITPSTATVEFKCQTIKGNLGKNPHISAIHINTSATTKY
jgi:hypothetical protein